MKYKVGDKVWIREDIREGDQGNGKHYDINGGEVDIRGKLVKITKDNGVSYSCRGYKFFFEEMINHSKTKDTPKDTPKQTKSKEPNYEIY